MRDVTEPRRSALVDQPLLDGRDLTGDVTRRGESVRVFEGVDLTMKAGERVALVRESGPGKSVDAHPVMRLNPALTANGVVNFAGTNLLKLTEKQMRLRRGSDIGIVLQDPLRAL